MLMVLCISSIAFGVYSAQKAQLNITGNLGFTAHNAFVSVTGFVKNVAQIENDNVVGKTDIAIDKIVKGADTTDPVNITMPLGDMYFYSNDNNVSAEDIVFELTFTNLGSTDIIATITKPSLSSTVTVIDNSNGDNSSYISFGETGTHQVGIYKGESKKISFAMRLNVMSTISSKVSFNMPINFEEWIYKIGVTVKEFTPTEQDTIKNGLGSSSYSETILCYAKRFPYYVEMGTDPTGTTNKLRWLIVGTMDANDNIALLGDDDKAAFADGLMLNNKNYCLLSQNILYTENTGKYGLSFQNAFTNSGAYLNTKYGVKANDYATSNIREYLKGNTVNRNGKNNNGVYEPSETEVNLMSTYNLSSDPLYSQIQARTLNSLYTKMSDSGTNITVPTSTTSTPVDTTSDKLWLLSYSEMQTLFNDDKSGNYYMYARTSILGNTSAARWWIRSPNSSDARSVRCVDSSGELYSYRAYSIGGGVRPAFKI